MLKPERKVARLSIPQPSRDPYGTALAVAATVWHSVPSRGHGNHNDSLGTGKHLPGTFEHVRLKKTQM